MVQEFLKIAGVKTQAEFYKKYPSEEAFFRAHPQARHLANRKMKTGAIRKYQVGDEVGPGPEPERKNYPDDRSFQAAHEQWLFQMAAIARNNPSIVNTNNTNNTGNTGSNTNFTSIEDLPPFPGGSQSYVPTQTYNQFDTTPGGGPTPYSMGITDSQLMARALDSQMIANYLKTNNPDSVKADTIKKDTIPRVPVFPYAPTPTEDSPGTSALKALGVLGGIGAVGGLAYAFRGKEIPQVKPKPKPKGKPRTPKPKAPKIEKVPEVKPEIPTRSMWNSTSTGQNVNVMTEEQRVQKALQALEEQKLIKANAEAAKVAEATRLAEAAKIAEAGKLAEAAKAGKLGTKMFEGLKAIKNAKYIGPVIKGAGRLFKAIHEEGGQHNDYSGTYSNGSYYQAGGAYNPTSMDYGEGLPHFDVGATMPQAMYGMAYGGMYADGGSPLYSTQGQALRNFMNTVAYTPGGWMPNHFELPRVGRYQDGGGMPPEQAAMMAQQQGQQMAPPQQGPPQQGGGMDPQQIMEQVAQMLQQGAQPEQVMQQLVQMGIPQDVAQQIIQAVMQQLQGGQEQQQMAPEQMAPQQGQMAYGGTYAKGGEYNMSHAQVQDLINKGYKIEYL